MDGHLLVHVLIPKRAERRFTLVRVGYGQLSSPGSASVGIRTVTVSG